MATAGHAVLVSGTTVAIGLLALVALPLPVLRSVGYGGMVIPLVSVAATLTLLPVVLWTAGDRLEWPRRRRGAQSSNAWETWTEWVVRHRLAAATASVLLLGGLTAAATTLHLGPAPGEPNTISQRGDARVGLMALENSGLGSARSHR
jgi:putative drug exporter of the RND superfamily